MKKAISEALSRRRSAILAVGRFPVRSQTILGGNPKSSDRSKKSASKVTIVKPFCWANRHISVSVQLSRPTCRTWRQSAKPAGNRRRIRNEIFWSNSSFISGLLQGSLPLCGKGKAGKNILPREFGEVGKNLVVGHAFRKPFQHVVNRNAGFSHTRLPETLFGTDCDNIVKTGHRLYIY